MATSSSLLLSKLATKIEETTTESNANPSLLTENSLLNLATKALNFSTTPAEIVTPESQMLDTQDWQKTSKYLRFLTMTLTANTN